MIAPARGALLVLLIFLPCCASIGLNKGESIGHQRKVLAPLSEFDFEEGDWCAYLVVHRTDIDKWKHKLPSGSCLISCENRLLVQMKKEWIFEATGRDTTLASSFIVFKDDIKMFEALISLDDGHEGLQNGTLGYIVPASDSVLSETLKHFIPTHGERCTPLVPD